MGHGTPISSLVHVSCYSLGLCGRSVCVLVTLKAFWVGSFLVDARCSTPGLTQASQHLFTSCLPAILPLIYRLFYHLFTSCLSALLQVVYQLFTSCLSAVYQLAYKLFTTCLPPVCQLVYHLFTS